ncbi:hypothetical protein HDU92_000204 [Lobulomyces angularis]|nr:hypothetical protein HDU92_000204 [Lobulomyces angularis]
MKNPDDKILYIGETTKTKENAEEFCERNKLWANSKEFVDEFSNYMIDINPVWKNSLLLKKGKIFNSATAFFDFCLRLADNTKPERHSSIKDNWSMFHQCLIENNRGSVDINPLKGSLLRYQHQSASSIQSTLVSDASVKNCEAWKTEDINVPPLNVLIMIVGSRGDVQPFVALGKELKAYGHRVRLATHEAFRKLVTENELDFYSIAGDPVELMAYMVKNPGLIPGIESIRNGDIGKKKKMLAEIMETSWLACIDSDPITGEQFTAQAIISNPPTYAHLHCAEKLSIPFHIFFTMPWSATGDFPHPLINMNSYKVKRGSSKAKQNLKSYTVIDELMWSGLSEIINNFRTNTLNLYPLPVTNSHNLIKDLKIPFTYCWSENLINKPQDWGEHIDISGFFFLELACNYNPPKDLQDFLEAGPKPIYIGFGSIVIDDPAALIKLLFEAVSLANVRAIISEQWGLKEGLEIPENIFMLGNCPHDWLFDQVNAVIHHGGAGTTAAGLLKGKPSIVVPFFGDQPFWGAMIARKRVGPEPIPFKSLKPKNLAQAIKFVLSEEILENAKQLGIEMRNENGVKLGVKSFHRQLPLENLICDIYPDQLAKFNYRQRKISIKVVEDCKDDLSLQNSALSEHKVLDWTREIEILNNGRSVFKYYLSLLLSIFFLMAPKKRPNIKKFSLKKLTLKK